MATLVENLKLSLDLDDDEVRLFRYFRRRYFAKRVRRHCLPPSRLYWRVRAVFEVFGTKVDPKTNKALFNKIAWTKGKGILKEILCGYYSDHPGEVMYKYELTWQRMMKPMPAMLPTRFPMIDRNNFQPLIATTFVGGMPISSGDPSSLSFDSMRRNNPSRGRDKVSVRKPRNPSRRRDKVSLRKPRTCQNCKLTDCEAAKPGKSASGLKRTCSQSPSAC
jgi:hypothetical protein